MPWKKKATTSRQRARIAKRRWKDESVAQQKRWTELQAKLEILETWLEKAGSFPVDFKQPCFLAQTDGESSSIISLCSAGKSYMMWRFPASHRRYEWWQEGRRPLLTRDVFTLTEWRNLEPYQLIRAEPYPNDMQRPTMAATWEEFMQGRSWWHDASGPPPVLKFYRPPRLVQLHSQVRILDAETQARWSTVLQEWKIDRWLPLALFRLILQYVYCIPAL